VTTTTLLPSSSFLSVVVVTDGEGGTYLVPCWLVISPPHPSRPRPHPFSPSLPQSRSVKAWGVVGAGVVVGGR
jgi:hypothetical protein